MSRITAELHVTWSRLIGRLRRQEGQTLTEYALIITMMSLGLVIALTVLRNELRDFFSTVVDKF